MRKKTIIIAAACVLLLAVAAGVIFSGSRPFRDLKASDIASATVLLAPPDRTFRIMDLQELTEYLNDAVIYNEDNSYTDYAGQGVVFTLTMVDGSQTRVMAYNPFLVIDGVGYRTKYEPCQALNAYANRLMNEGNAPEVKD